MALDISNKKVAYFEGRPHGHPTHSLYAKSVGADFYHFDKYLRYHDNIKPTKAKTYLSWLLTACFFPKREYDIFLTQEPYYAIALMKIMRLIPRDKKIVSMFGTHTLYFIKENRYSTFSKKMLLFLFSKYDSIICEGDMQKELLINFLRPYKTKPQIYSIPNGSKATRLKVLLTIKPQLTSNKILTVASAVNRSRLFYKGLDLNIKAFDQLIKDGNDYYYDIIGDVSKDLQKELLDLISEETKKRVQFLGQIDDFELQISTYSLCLHISRGEAWGISINDCMAAGIPTLVSEWTGSKQIVSEVSQALITTFNANEIVTAIQKYYRLSIVEKQFISEKCKNVSLKYSEEYSVSKFQYYFNKSIHKDE